jgi:hypothetical protein
MMQSSRIFAATWAVALGVGLMCGPIFAQNAGWQADVDIKKQAPGKSPKGANPNTTVIERGDAKGGAQQSGTPVKLVALLTADGQQIDQGLVWRVYLNSADAAAKAKLVTENREPSPSLRLQPGDYTVNASFGRANLTRRITIKPGLPATEQFVLNAGGLRVSPAVSGKPAAQNTISYAIYSDDRDQFANRTAVLTGARPGLVIRLNAGIYHVISTYGDANAKVETDVTVEAGKLTEASIAHTAGRANFKLVTRTGGEALPETHWSIQSSDGEIVKESVGALPTHILAPGDYAVTAKAAGRAFKRNFSLKDGDMTTVEVVMEGAEPQAEALDLNPSLEIKNP